MSNFAGVIGFLFTFIIISFFIFTSFINFNENILFQNELLQTKANSFEKIQNLEIEEIYFLNNRLKFKIKNEVENFEFKECYNFIIDGKIIDKSLIDIIPIKDNFFLYDFLKKNEEFFIEVFYGKNTSQISKIILFDCFQNKKIFYNTDINEINGFNKIEKNFTNPNSNHIINYSIEDKILDYQNYSVSYLSNFFSRIFYDNFFLVDLTFDKLSQEVENYGKEEYDIFLKDSSLVESGEPKLKKGLVLNSYDFENNYIKIKDFKTQNSHISFNFWFKPKNDLNNNSNEFKIIEFSSDTYLIYNQDRNGKLKYVEDSFELISEKYIFEKNKWHMITITLTNSTGKLYVNSILENEVSRSSFLDLNSDIKIGEII